MTRSFAHVACLDWSGQAVERPRGIALAIDAGDGEAPKLLAPAGGWSRAAVLDWLIAHATAGTDMIVGIDFSPAFPFVDAGAFFPGWSASPADARKLWALVDDLCAGDPHLSVSGFVDHPEASRHFRRHGGRLGDLFPGGAGRMRVVEQRCRATGLGAAQSCFNLVGAAQVGKSSLSGMRLLHRLAGRVPVWPFDPVPARGPLIVEIYTTIAARRASVRGGSKIRTAEALDAALATLGRRPHRPLARYDDHATDAILTAAWLRHAIADRDLWHPPGLDDTIRQTEGWTFGVT